MPELAELARFAHDLNLIVGGRKISAVRANRNDKFSDKIAPADALGEVKENVGYNAKFISVGKSLILTLPKKNKIVNFKLGMTGRFQENVPDKFKDHVFWSLKFEDKSVHYLDPRRFGSVQLCTGLPEKEREMSLGGYDGKNLSLRELPRIFKYLNKKVTLSRTPRITWLLNTGKYTGIGNYMANEALGSLGLNPFKPFINKKEILLVFKRCQEIAAESYKLGGYSFGGGYYMLDGEPGKFEGKYYQNLPRQVFKNRPVYTNFKLET